MTYFLETKKIVVTLEKPIFDYNKTIKTFETFLQSLEYCKRFDKVNLNFLKVRINYTCDKGNCVHLCLIFTF